MSIAYFPIDIAKLDWATDNIMSVENKKTEKQSS